jgi:hypothetical protein
MMDRNFEDHDVLIDVGVNSAKGSRCDRIFRTDNIQQGDITLVALII